MIAAITGHRKLGGYITPNPIYTFVAQKIEKALIELKPDKILSGMAIGADQLACEICIKLGIPYIAAIPHKGQELFWPKEAQVKYHELLDSAEKIETISPGGFASWKMQARNQWMVDRADVLIAIFSGAAGGTKNCFEYAEKKKKHILRIDPNDFK
jgi:uncharacterized phage-like protein YoqJ